MNEGSDAFKPEVYGNRIVIERKIFKAGGRTEYKISSSTQAIYWFHW